MQNNQLNEDSYDKYVKLHKASFGVHPEDDNTEIHHVQKTSKGTMHVVWSHPDHNDDERGNYHVSAFKHDGKKGDYAGGGPESSHHSEEDAISHAKSLKKSTNEDISDMIDQLVDGNTEQAEQAFDAAISVKVIDTLDALKMDVAANLYGEATETPINHKAAIAAHIQHAQVHEDEADMSANSTSHLNAANAHRKAAAALKTGNESEYKKHRYDAIKKTVTSGAKGHLIDMEGDEIKKIPGAKNDYIKAHKAAAKHHFDLANHHESAREDARDNGDEDSQETHRDAQLHHEREGQEHIKLSKEIK